MDKIRNRLRLTDVSHNTSMRFGSYTVNQLADLENFFGMTRTAVIAMLIDRAWQREVKNTPIVTNGGTQADSETV